MISPVENGPESTRSGSLRLERALRTPAARTVNGSRGQEEAAGPELPPPHSRPDSRGFYLEPAAAVICAMTWSSEKLAGFMRGGNSLKLVSHLAM